MYLKCGRLEEGCVRYMAEITALLAADPDAVTLVRRFGSSLKLNIHSPVRP